MRAFLFPGQGVLRVGMGRWLRAQPAAAAVFGAASDFLSAENGADVDLGQLCARGPLPVLVATENAQPAVTVCAMAALAVLREHGIAPSVVAGHSVGELSALYAAGVLDFADTLRLVNARARLMARITDDGAMCSVLGLDHDTVAGIAARAAQDEPLVVGLENAPGHLVLSGARAAVDRGAALAIEAGARKVTRLEVSNAFHSPLMASVVRPWAELVRHFEFAEPTCPVIPNVDAEPTTDPVRLTEALVAQLTGQVRWADTMRRVAAMGISRCVEVGDSKVLSGLARNAEAGLRCETVDRGLLRTATDRAGEPIAVPVH